jgi:hypothetical protein
LYIFLYRLSGTRHDDHNDRDEHDVLLKMTMRPYCRSFVVVVAIVVVVVFTTAERVQKFANGNVYRCLPDSHMKIYQTSCASGSACRVPATGAAAMGSSSGTYSM